MQVTRYYEIPEEIKKFVTKGRTVKFYDNKNFMRCQLDYSECFFENHYYRDRSPISKSYNLYKAHDYTNRIDELEFIAHVEDYSND